MATHTHTRGAKSKHRAVRQLLNALVGSTVLSKMQVCMAKMAPSIRGCFRKTDTSWGRL